VIILIVIVVLGVITAGIVLLVRGVTGVVGNTAQQDFIKIGSDEVPSVKFILGEERQVTGISSSTNPQGSEKVIKYRVAQNQKEDMMIYALTLLAEYGYTNITDYDFTGPTGTDFKFAKESVQDGYIVVVKIDYDYNGYTITLTYSKGWLEPLSNT